MKFNYLHVVIVTCKCFHEEALQWWSWYKKLLSYSKKSAENEGIQGSL